MKKNQSKIFIHCFFPASLPRIYCRTYDDSLANEFKKQIRKNVACDFINKLESVFSVYFSSVRYRMKYNEKREITKRVMNFAEWKTATLSPKLHTHFTYFDSQQRRASSFFMLCWQLIFVETIRHSGYYKNKLKIIYRSPRAQTPIKISLQLLIVPCTASQISFAIRSPQAMHTNCARCTYPGTLSMSASADRVDLRMHLTASKIKR